MASKKVKIEFTSDFEPNKKGDVKEFSRDNATLFIRELKVAKIYEEKKKESKSKNKE